MSGGTVETTDEARECRDLARRLADLRGADDFTNLGWLAWEYACLAALIGGAIAFAECRAAWGLPWAWNVPVFAAAIVLVGAIQHRLAGLGHEASHETLFRNRLANDLAGDVLCLFPILATVHTYRLFHMAHHRFTNDPERDPDLVNLGRSKKVDEFPMARSRVLAVLFLRWLTDPWSMVLYQADYFYVNTLGKGGNVLLRGVDGGDADDPRPRAGTMLGISGLIGHGLLTWALVALGRSAWLPVALLAALAIAALGAATVPRRWLFRSPFPQAYGARVGGLLRLAYYLVVFTALGWLGAATGGRAPWYAFALWMIPMGTSFAYFMLLRDVFQHTNADAGRLTNSRVFFADPFTRWAVFVYGQDVHLTHHLHPGVPHHRLRRLHRLLRETDPRYRASVVECHGTFVSDGAHPTILDVLTTPTQG
jgi:fatty acid desaturase